MNELIKTISISFITNQSIILELFNSFTSMKGLYFISIPFWVSLQISTSNTIINYHSLILLYQWSRNQPSILSIQREKEDLINQSHFLTILLIINEFLSTVPISPARAHSPRIIDSNWGRSYSSFIQSLILSNTIEWQFRNESRLISRVVKEERFDRLNVSSSFPTPPLITIHLTKREICSSSLVVDIHNTDEYRDNKSWEGGRLLLNMINDSRAQSQSLSINQSYLNKPIL